MFRIEHATHYLQDQQSIFEYVPFTSGIRLPRSGFFIASLTCKHYPRPVKTNKNLLSRNDLHRYIFPFYTDPGWDLLDRWLDAATHIDDPTVALVFSK